MNDNNPPSLWQRLSIEARFRLVALVVAVVGGVSSAVQWATTTPMPATELEFSRSRALEFQLERIGGKFAVMSARLDTWFESLWSGRNLAWTLLVLTVAAVGILLAAGRLASPGPADRRR